MSASPDKWLSEWITGLAGHVDFIDGIMSLIASDFFIPVSLSMAMLYLWFGTRDPIVRVNNQYGAMCASVSLGFASLGVHFFNRVLDLDFWPRPFDVSESARDTAEAIFYLPHDPSFPANIAAVTFGAAMGMWFYNRNASKMLFGIAVAWSVARVYAGVHYPLDILGGAVIGIAMAGWSYFLMKLLWPMPAFCFWVARKFYLA